MSTNRLRFFRKKCHVPWGSKEIKCKNSVVLFTKAGIKGSKVSFSNFCFFVSFLVSFLFFLFFFDFLSHSFSA